MIIWITGISGVGKTTLAKVLYKKLEKKNSKIVHIDGDRFRKLFNNDLGYTLKHRNINAERLINFVSFLNNQKINIIISANLTSQKYRVLNKKKFKKYIEVNIASDLKNLKKRNKKNIYSNKKNVVGIDIENIKNNTATIKILNNSTKKLFLNNISTILNAIK